MHQSEFIALVLIVQAINLRPGNCCLFGTLLFSSFSISIEMRCILIIFLETDVEGGEEVLSNGEENLYKDSKIRGL